MSVSCHNVDDYDIIRRMITVFPTPPILHFKSLDNLAGDPFSLSRGSFRSDCPPRPRSRTQSLGNPTCITCFDYAVRARSMAATYMQHLSLTPALLDSALRSIHSRYPVQQLYKETAGWSHRAHRSTTYLSCFGHQVGVPFFLVTPTLFKRREWGSTRTEFIHKPR